MTEAPMSGAGLAPGAVDERDYPTKAIWALVVSCMGLLMPIIGVAGLVLGVSALRDIDRRAGGGRSFALAAVVVGAVDVVVVVLLLVLMLGVVDLGG